MRVAEGLRSTTSSPGALHPWKRAAAWVLVPALLLASCEASAEIRDPVPLFDQVPIEYPLDLWQDGVEGMTLIRVLVGAEGSVDSVVVVESSGHRAFDSAAVDGARLLRFEPAVREGEPIQVWARVPVHFTREGAGVVSVEDADGPDTAATADTADAASSVDAASGPNP